jgi:hypothetical protein
MVAFPLAGYSEVTTPPVGVPSPVAPPNNNPAIAAASPNFSPNINELIKLSNAGVGDAVVLAFIKNSPTPYELSSSSIVQLKKQGISSDVIAAMLNHDAALRGNYAPPGPASGPDYNSQRFYGPTNGVQYAPPQVAQSAPPPEPAPSTVQAPPSQPAPPAPSPTIIVQTAPTPVPPPQVEVVTVAPGPDYYWTPGYWRWNGSWIWVGGGWGFRAGWGPHRGWGGYHRGWEGHHR